MVPESEMSAPTQMEKFLFDLQGYIVVKNALSRDEVKDLNDCLDSIPRLKPGEWHGYVHGHAYGTKDGLNYQQAYEAGEPFEKLIDHPSWYEKVRCFVGGEGNFDYHHGPMFIDENFANFRGPGEAIGIHSGGFNRTMRGLFSYHDGQFHCGQVNVLMAFTDIGPGDGGTMLIPASHKSNIWHPGLAGNTIGDGGSAEPVEGAVEVHMEAGDALIFVDSLCHGSARRSNPDERRVCVYRYGPSWGNFRHGYHPSPELLERLNPRAKQIVWPQKDRIPREPQVPAKAQETANA